MAAARKFYVRRGTTKIKKAQSNGTGGTINPVGNGGSNSTPPAQPAYQPFVGNPTTPTPIGAYNQPIINMGIDSQNRANPTQAQFEYAQDQRNAYQRTADASPEAVEARAAEEAAAQQRTQDLAIYDAQAAARAAARGREEGIGESAEDRADSDEDRDVDNIEQESISDRDRQNAERQAAEEAAETQRNAELQQQRALEQAGIAKETEKKWKRFERNEKMVAGLGLGTDVAAKTIGALGSFINLGRAFMQNPLSSPTAASRALITAVVNMGAAAQDVLDAIGQSLGIKDGVRQQDIAGTFRGAKYYDEHKNAEIVQQQFNKEMEYIAKDVFGEDADPARFGKLLQNAIDNNDVDTVRKITDRLVEIIDRPENQAMIADMMREIKDRNNKGVDKKNRHQAKAQSRMFYALYSNYIHGVVNAAEHIGAINRRRATEIRSRIQFQGEVDRNNAQIARNEERDRQNEAERAAAQAQTTQRNNWYNALSTADRQFVDTIEGVMGENWFTQMDNLRASDGHLAISDKKKAMELFRALEWKKGNGGLTSDERRIYKLLNVRLNGVPRAPITAEDRLRALYNRNNQYDGMGGSFDNGVCNEITSLALREMRVLERDGKKNTERYRRWQCAYHAARLSKQYNQLYAKLHDPKTVAAINKYLAKHPANLKGVQIKNAQDLLQYLNNNRKKASTIWGAYGTPVGRRVMDPEVSQTARAIMYGIPSLIRLARK